MIAKAMTPPTAECVVETGTPYFELSNSHEAAENSTQVIPLEVVVCDYDAMMHWVTAYRRGL